jgi:parvulin-like peptidyl-prolyl isomerase
MTLRARPVAKRPGRSGWDSGDRRTTLINAAFAGAIVVSILILLGYAGWTWYDSHFGQAGSVDGQVITKDDVRNRMLIEKFRIDYTTAQIQKLLAAGHITQSVASQQLSFLQQRSAALESLTLERLIDVKLQASLASQAGISVSDAEVDAQLAKEATTDEQRHVWMIEVQPAVDPLIGQVGPIQKAEAKAKAETALAELRAGKSWDDVAKTVSTATSAPQAGDISWVPKDSGYDQKFMAAVFAAQVNTPTEVIEGDDGIFRIGRVTEISPSTVDQAFAAKLDNVGIGMADYRVAVRADVLRQKLSDSVVADLSKPSLQRHVLQIFLKAVNPQPNGVLVRHILFAPNHDATKAPTLVATDPAWAQAKAAAAVAYQELLKDPTRFDLLARTLSDDTASQKAGGKTPSDGTFYDSTSPLDKAFAAAIFTTGLKPGDIIPPFKDAYGWEIVQFMRPYGDGNQAWLETIKTQAQAGADFSQLARDQGFGEEAAKGGDIGWIAQGQLGDAREGPIFDATIGSVPDVVDIPNNGDYLFKVIGEETRPATPDQIAIFNQTGFTNWYSLKKAAATITRDLATSPVTG